MRTTHPVTTTDGRRGRASRHVLLVEDDARIAMALRLRLEAEGHRVSRAADLAGASDGVLDDRPDVVVLDVNLPDGNGLGLAERMGRLRATANVPLVVITASRDPRHRERAARLEVDLLEKPFTAEALEEALERAATRGRREPPRAMSVADAPERDPPHRLSRGSIQA